MIEHDRPQVGPLERFAPVFVLAADLPFPDEEAARRPALHFAHARFEARELDLLAAADGPEAAADPEASGTIVAAAVLAALSPPPPFGNNHGEPEGP